MHLAAGLSVGSTGLAAGYAIGVVGDVVSSCFSAIFVFVLKLMSIREFGLTCCNQEFSWAWC